MTAAAGSPPRPATARAASPPPPPSSPRPSATRPGAVEITLYSALLALALVGLGSPGRYSLLPAETILEVAFALATVLSMARFDVAARSFLLVALVYATTKTALMAFSGSPAWLDYIQAYKAYFYLVALAFFVRRRCFDGVRVARVSAVLTAAFLVKYGYSQALHLDPRPGLYTENNFELIMLLGLFYLGFPYAGRSRHLVFAALTATVLLSGSRSGALGLLIVYVALYLRARNRFWPLHLLGVAGVGAAVAALFLSRDPQGLQSVDRYHFLQVFLREVRPWPLWEFLTGSYPITPLSPASCHELAYYVNEFSYSQPGVCYSVILHSYLLRAVLDQGLLGLGVLYGLVWLALHRSGASGRDVVVLLGILTVSGLSVSAFNSVFAAITLAVALGLARPGPRRPPDGGRPWSATGRGGLRGDRYPDGRPRPPRGDRAPAQALRERA